MIRSVLALGLALAVSLAPCEAEAQMDGPTYQDSTGLTWSVATLELGLILSAVAVAASDSQSASAVGILALILTAIAGGVVAGVTQEFNAPVEPPMVFHHGLTGGALTAGLLAFSLRVSGVRDDTPNYVALAGMLLGAGGMATYSVLRMERLAHDPALLEEAHVLSWLPLLSAGLTAALLSAAGLGDGAALVAAVVGLIGLGISITAVEVAIAENPAPEPPMMSPEPLIAAGGWRF